MTCSIEGCNRPVKIKSRGWCQTHYFRWRRNGDPLAVKTPAPPPETVKAGDRRGDWTVVAYSHTDADHHRHYLCRCACGTERTMTASELGRAQMCRRCADRLSGVLNRTHGLEGTAAYATWLTMTQRCHKAYATAYANYGGRGITVYPTWRGDFSAWWEYVRQLPDCPYDERGHRVIVGVSLDRINVDGNYEPGNLRWATAVEQRRNQRPSSAESAKPSTP